MIKKANASRLSKLKKLSERCCEEKLSDFGGGGGGMTVLGIIPVVYLFISGRQEIQRFSLYLPYGD